MSNQTSPTEGTEPTDEQIETFRAAWLAADGRKEQGGRIRAGLRAVLTAHPAPEGVNLTDAERAEVCACPWTHTLAPGDTHTWECSAYRAKVERIIAARQSPTVATPAPTVESADRLIRAIRTLLPGLQSANFVERWSPGSPAVRALDILIKHVSGEADVIPGDLISPDVPTAHACRPEGLPCPTDTPTVALDVETVAQALSNPTFDQWAVKCSLCGSRPGRACYGAGDMPVRMTHAPRLVASRIVAQAAAVLAADARRTEATVKAEALREAARIWGEGEWQEAWMADRVSCDVSAVQSTVGWFNDRAARIEAGQ